MGLKSAVPVRFDQQTADRLKAIKEKTGVPVAKLVRLATEQWLDEVEKSRSIRILLPKQAEAINSSRGAEVGADFAAAAVAGVSGKLPQAPVRPVKYPAPRRSKKRKPTG